MFFYDKKIVIIYIINIILLLIENETKFNGIYIYKN
jgi:hypothetical protein